MRVRVKTIVPVDYKSKKTGEQVKGTELHIIRPVNEREKAKGTRGSEITDKIFTRLDCTNVQPEKNYEMVYECTGGRFADLVEIKAVS